MTASVVLPLVMASGTGLTGVYQRVMFLVAYVWYGLEAIAPSRGGAPVGADRHRQLPSSSQ